MFGKVYKNHKLKISDLVINDVHASVFDSAYWQGKGWQFEAVVKLKESISESGQTIYQVDGVVSYDERINLTDINDPRFDETTLEITGQLEDGKARKTKAVPVE